MSEARALSLAYLEAHPADAARVLEQLTPTDTAELLRATPLRLAAPVAQQMLPLFAARVMDSLADTFTVGLLRAMGAQSGVAVLRQMPVARVDALVNQLPTATAVAFRLLLGYPGNTVGAWADPLALTLTADLTVAQALATIRSNDYPHDTLYVLGRDQRLIGVLPAASLLRADAQDSLRRWLQAAPPSLPAQALISATEDHPGWLLHRALPVVERGERFAGVLRQSSLRQALAPEPRGEASAASGDGLTLVAEGYWLSVSMLVEWMVSWLPGTPKRLTGDRHGH